MELQIILVVYTNLSLHGYLHHSLSSNFVSLTAATSQEPTQLCPGPALGGSGPPPGAWTLGPQCVIHCI